MLWRRLLTVGKWCGTIRRFLLQFAAIAYDNDIPVESASFKKYDEESADVKRVFVKKNIVDKEYQMSL